jgi:hypothetical protein
LVGDERVAHNGGMSLVGRLPACPLDVIGDVHGEIGALEELLHGRLGYARDGSHPQVRCAIFVGDLVDRGEDSLAVVWKVREWIRSGRARCVLGNHELNLLLSKRRAGNEWFHGEEQALRGGAGVIPQRVLGTQAERDELTEFLSGLPLALERADLRIVHACWRASAIDALRGDTRTAQDRFWHEQLRIDEELQARGIARDSLAADLERQNGNPVSVCTSGLERAAAVPFRAGGRMRRVERLPWWEDYRDETAVVFGHYWRALDEADRPVKRGPYLFEGHGPSEALGPLRNAYCVDFGVGYRNTSRALNGDPQGRRNALAALRWPERELVADIGALYGAG